MTMFIRKLRATSFTKAILKICRCFLLAPLRFNQSNQILNCRKQIFVSFLFLTLLNCHDAWNVHSLHSRYWDYNNKYIIVFFSLITIFKIHRIVIRFCHMMNYQKISQIYRMISSIDNEMRVHIGFKDLTSIFVAQLSVHMFWLYLSIAHDWNKLNGNISGTGSDSATMHILLEFYCFISLILMDGTFIAFLRINGACFKRINYELEKMPKSFKR